MHQTFDVKLRRILTGIIAIVLVLLPFHAFLTVWLASLLGHYTELRLWKEVLLVPVGMGAAYLVARDQLLRRRLFGSQLTRLILGFVALQLLIGIVEHTLGRVDIKALAYGWLVDMRFLLFFLTVAIVAARNDWLRRHWRQILLLPAMAVVLFGLLQVTLLPPDFLRHFGYSAATIDPYETINQNQDYVRILSTLRGSNPLGAYLLLPITALLVLCFYSKDHQRIRYGLFGILASVVLFFSFSRAAWIGTSISLGIVLWIWLKHWQARRWLVVALVTMAAGLGGILVALQQSTHLDNIFFHTEDAATAPSSNAGHLSALQHGLGDIVQEPLGRGPGTAGPASVYNDGQTRLAENFFIQIGQEVGWFGLALFCLIVVLIALLLWRGRQDSLALTLFASFVGITFINLVSHAWTDDTLCYIWWGLAGIASAPLLVESKHREPKQHASK